MLESDTPISVVGCNHHQTPLELREKITLTPERMQQLRDSLTNDSECGEFVILNTCNRVEIYWVRNHSAHPAKALAHLCKVNGFSEEEIAPYSYVRSGKLAIQHLFEVASGLNSQIVGETEILGQVKSAYQEAQDCGSIGPFLHRVFQKSFQAAKWARTHTGIGSGQVSLGNIAVELATRIFGRLTVARTLVVGSGEVGQDVAKALRSRGVACISIASRTADRAEELARSIDGLIIPYASWKTNLPYVDIAIFATSAPGSILNKADIEPLMRKRPSRPIFLIDLAVPRDVEADVSDLGSVYLYNYDDLANIANENLRNRSIEVQTCRDYLKQRAERLFQSISAT
jgi:glutamyl-tRNA reductase